MKRTLLSSLTLLAAALFAPAFAHADTFVITSVTSSTFKTFSFSLPHSPVLAPADYNVSGGYFNVSTTVTVPGATPNPVFTDVITFLTNAQGGGIADNFFLDPSGPQLFSGSVSSPTFLNGTFNLSNEGVGGPTDYILVVTGAASTTPEPSSIVLLGTGALGLAGSMRRRLRK